MRAERVTLPVTAIDNPALMLDSVSADRSRYQREPLEPSSSRICFSTRDGDVFVLSERMDGDHVRPVRVSWC